VAIFTATTSHSLAGFLRLRGDDYCCGYLVVGVEVEELDAGGVAAGGADGPGIDADDFAELGDEHPLGGVVGQEAWPVCGGSGRSSRSISSRVIPESHLWRSAV
jgi:hypothetical protein